MPYRRRGFTLIEVLVAASLLALSIGAVLRLGQIAVRNQDVAVERIQAYQLIQEAAEIVHQVRDSNVRDQIVNPFWDDGLPANGLNRSPVWDGVARRWTFVAENADPLVSHGQATITLGGMTFRRTVRLSAAPTQLAPLTNDQGQTVTGALGSQIRQVTVEVRWRSHGQDWAASATTLLSNWQGV